MNLQSTINQTGIFPFGFVNSNAEKLFEKPKDNIPKQQRKTLEFKDDEVSRKTNLSLSPEATIIIGENGTHRFDEFKTYLSGWYGGKGKKISKWSVFNFERFVKQLPELKLFHPSLFLTIEGNLSLGWKDQYEQSIEIEFHPDKIEYFIEKLDEESVIRLADIFEFTEKIKKILK